MKIIDQLYEHIDEIKRTDEWAFKYIRSIKKQKKEHPEKPLTGSQFSKLCEIHSRYCGGI